MDIKTFKLQDWIEKDLILMKHMNTADNCADALTKLMGRQLYYCHNDYFGQNHSQICCCIFPTTPYRSIILYIKAIVSRVCVCPCVRMSQLIGTRNRKKRKI